MEITVEFLKEKKACFEAVEAFDKQKETRLVPLLREMMQKGKLDWANWLIVRCMTYHQYVSYAIYAAEQVIDIYKKKHPTDNRPQNAIKKAKACLIDPSKENKTASDAAYAAYAAAASAASAASAAAYAAAYAAYAAYVASAASAASYAASAAYAAYAASAASAARKKIQTNILKYGIKLLKELGER